MPSTKIGAAPLVAPSAADTYFGGATTATNGTGASGRAKEVVELARALKGDPDLIYEHVRNNTTTVWTYGLTKGAMGVIVDRSGTAFDQAQLMVELLREAGYSASYKLGTISLTGSQFQAWSGITSATAACQLLSSGGIPAIINGSTTANCAYGSATVSTVDISHAWVAVTIAGVTYLYDPAYKDHTFKAGMDLATATGMPSGFALGITAASGTASGVPWITNYGGVDTPYALSSAMGTYDSNLATAINANAPTGSLADVIGGKSINPQAIPPGGVRQLALPYTTNVLRTITGDMPDQYRAKLRVQVTKARPDTTTPTVIDKTVYADEVYGRRLTFEPNFDTTGASFTGALKLTDDMGAALSLGSVSYSDNPTYSRGAVTLTLDLPYAASSGAYMDAVVTRNVTYALPFTIVTGFGDIGRGLIDKWGQRKDAAMPAPPDSTCMVCFVSYKAWKGDGRRETLAAAWLAQASRAGQLHAAIGKGVFAQHYALGVSAADNVVFQTANGKYWITDSYDRLDVETGFSLTSVTADATVRRGAVLAAANTISALKGSVSAQISDLVDVSSVATRFQWGHLPEPSSDLAEGARRPYYLYSSATDAAQAMSLSMTEYQTTTADTGVHNSLTPTIGNTETEARRQALADAVSAYVSAGFSVAASAEAFLGPGKRAGAFVPVSGAYSHQQTPQRGGAFVATKYDANGEPVEVADILVNPGGYVDAGGGGTQLFHQMQYDPATSADVVKGRYVVQPPGTVLVTSPATVRAGSGGFPFGLTATTTWRGGEVRDDTYGGAAHREPQGGWTTNFNNNLTFSGSGLEAMGESDVRAATDTIVAFYAAQDAYRAAPSLKREVVGQLITAWWLQYINWNVATVAIGTETRQWIRTGGNWITPGGATYGKLIQGYNTPITILPRHAAGQYTACGSQMIPYVPTRGWSYAGVTFTVVGAKGDQQVFSNWTNLIDAGSTCAEQHGFRLTTWTWLNGVQLTFNYAAGSTAEVANLTSVINNVSQYISFNNGGAGGFYVGQHLQDVTFSQSGAQAVHTDPVGAVTKFDIATLGTGDFAKLRIDKVYTADSASGPAVQYIYDTLGRVAQVKDRFALAGSRAPFQYFLANGLRGETVDALGYSSIVYADLEGRPVRTIDAAGAVSTVSYDGRGRAVFTTSPDGDRTQIEYIQPTYSKQNLPTKVTRLAKVGSPEAGQTLVAETGWNSTWNLDLPVWTKDAKGAQTDINYYYGEVSQVTLPPATAGAGRDTIDAYYYGNGLEMATTTAMGRNLAKTYSGVSWQTLTDTAGSTSGVYQAWGRTPLGDPAGIITPRNAVTDILYDALRRPVETIEPLPQAGGTTRNARRITYDLLGRVTKVVRGTYTGPAYQPLATWTFSALETYTSEYDAVGNRVKQVGPAGVVQMSYDAANRPVCIAVRMNLAVYANLPADACQPSEAGAFGPDRISRTSYDAAGRVTQTEIGVGSSLQQVTARYGYSPGGQRTTLTDANGNTSTFEYDGFRRLKRLRYPASPRGSGVSSTTDYEEYGYDVNGNRTSFRKRDGQVITYAYDDRNRLISKDLPGTTADDVYYSYLNNGREVQGRLGSSAASLYHKMVFDEAGRLLTDQGLNTTPTGTDFTGYQATYAAGGNRLTGAFGNTTAYYTYDLAERLTGVTYTTTAGQTPATLETIAYGPLNLPSTVTRPNGVVTGYAFDPAGRLTGLSHGATDVGSGSYQSYAYNPAGQLTGQDQRSGQYVWSGQPTTTVNFTHDQLNRDAAIAAASGYDGSGNLTSDGTRSFTYDAENRLRAVSGGPASVSLNYDPFGRLETVASGGATTTFRYAGAMLAAEYDMSNATVAQRQLRAYVSGNGDGELLLWTEGYGATPQPKWFEQDRLGSVISVSDAAGAVTPYTYGPYGEPQSWAGTRFRYTGQMAIPEAQLYHYRARAYDPMMGRFMQTDPIGYGDGPNIYAYVKGDPINTIDLDGLEGFTVDGITVTRGPSGGVYFNATSLVQGLSQFTANYIGNARSLVFGSRADQANANCRASVVSGFGNEVKKIGQSMQVGGYTGMVLGAVGGVATAFDPVTWGLSKEMFATALAGLEVGGAGEAVESLGDFIIARKNGTLGDLAAKEAYELVQSKMAEAMSKVLPGGKVSQKFGEFVADKTVGAAIERMEEGLKGCPESFN